MSGFAVNDSPILLETSTVFPPSDSHSLENSSDGYPDSSRGDDQAAGYQSAGRGATSGIRDNRRPAHQ